MTFNSGVLVPGVMTRVGSSRGEDSVQGANPPLLIGGRLSSGEVAAATLVKVTSASAAKTQFGAGSQLHLMVRAYRQIDPYGLCYAIAVDDASGTAEQRTITVTGPSTAAGTVALYVGGTRLAVGVASGASATAVGAAIAAAINADTSLPWTAAADTGVVTITAKHKGVVATQCGLGHSLLDGEALPAGIGIAFATTVAGATAPSIATAIAALGDAGFDYVACSFSDTSNIALLETEWGDVSGRWAPLREQYGWAMVVVKDTLSNLSTLGSARNAPHVPVVGIPAGPTIPYEVAAQVLAHARLSMDAHPARPLTGRALTVRPATTQWTRAEAEALLAAGVATLREQAGEVQIERIVTTYKTDADGETDKAWQDVQSSATVGRALRQFKTDVKAKYPRAVVVNDGTPVAATDAADGSVCWPGAIVSTHISTYLKLERLHWLENSAGFIERCVAVRDGTDAGRINSTVPLDVANPLRVVAIDATLFLNF